MILLHMDSLIQSKYHPEHWVRETVIFDTDEPGYAEEGMMVFFVHRAEVFGWSQT